MNSESAPSSSQMVVVVRPPAGPPGRSAADRVVDVVVGAAVMIGRPVLGVAAMATTTAGGGLQRVALPTGRVLARLVMHPPLLPEHLSPAAITRRWAVTGSDVRSDRRAGAAALVGMSADVAIPAVLGLVLDRVDLTELVLTRIDLQRVVSAALDSLDLTDVVLTRVDLQPVITSALDSLDLTTLVVDRVDLKVVIEAALDSMDLTELVRSRVDLATLADEVIDEVDLPEIIRDSTTGVASEAVQVARLGAISGDELVSKWVDRVLLRRKGRRTDAPEDTRQMTVGVHASPEDGRGSDRVSQS